MSKLSKSVIKIPFVLFITMVISLISSCILFYIQDFLFQGHPNAKPFQFLKIWSRMLTVVLFFIMIWFCRRVEKRSIRSYGLEQTANANQLWLGGFFLGVSSMLLLVCINLFFLDSNVQLKPLNVKFYVDLILQLFIVFTIAILEEWFFRGYILQTLATDFGIKSSVIISSLFFASTHFIRPVSHWSLLIPEFFGLFLIGIVLANSWVYTKTLYLSIGIHAGWVYIVKLDKYFANHFDLNLQKAFGGEKLLKSVYAWILIFLFLFFLKRIVIALNGTLTISHFLQKAKPSR